MICKDSTSIWRRRLSVILRFRAPSSSATSSMISLPNSELSRYPWCHLRPFCARTLDPLVWSPFTLLHYKYTSHALWFRGCQSVYIFLVTLETLSLHIYLARLLHILLFTRPIYRTRSYIRMLNSPVSPEHTRDCFHTLFFSTYSESLPHPYGMWRFYYLCCYYLDFAYLSSWVRYSCLFFSCFSHPF